MRTNRHPAVLLEIESHEDSPDMRSSPDTYYTVLSLSVLF